MKWLKPGDDNEKPVYLIIDRIGEDVLYTSIADRGVYTTEEWRLHYGQAAELLGQLAFCAKCGKPLLADAEILDTGEARQIVRWRLATGIHRGRIVAFLCWKCLSPRLRLVFEASKNADQ